MRPARAPFTASRTSSGRGASALAVRALESHPGEQSRVLLLTDGLANQGVTDPDELAAMVAEYNEHGVSTSTFGLGADFDETLLSRLATAGGGHFYFIETPQQIPDFFTSELGEALEIVAPGAELSVRAGPGVRVDVFHDLRVDQKEDEVRIALGDLVSEQEITVGIALHWNARLAGAPAAADIRVADRAGALFPQPMRIEWTTVDAAEDASQPVNRSVLVTIAGLIAARAAGAALDANRVAFYVESEQMLKGAALELRAMASGVEDVIAIADRLDHEAALHSEAMSPMAMKARHYASYSTSRGRDAKGKAKRTGPARSGT